MRLGYKHYKPEAKVLDISSYSDEIKKFVKYLIIIHLFQWRKYQMN